MAPANPKQKLIIEKTQTKSPERYKPNEYKSSLSTLKRDFPLKISYNFQNGLQNRTSFERLPEFLDKISAKSIKLNSREI